MILPGSATLILSGVQRLIQLGSRLDRLIAQRTAVESQLILGMPTLRLGNAQTQFALVKKALAETDGQSPDPFGSDRAALTQQLAQPDPRFDTLFAKYFPDHVNGLVVSPDANYVAELQKTFPGLDWKDPGVRIAAFAIGAGTNHQQVSYTARIALAVADTLLEFGADNTALFVRDPRFQGVVQSVLQRFAQPDWAGFEEWNPLLQTALQVSLNAALDAGDLLPQKNPWLDAVLDALVQSRSLAPNPDDFLLGLVQGKGVSLLLSQGVLVAGDRLDNDQSAPFKLVAADVLAAAAPFIQDSANPALGQFFRDHWGDLLRAGLTSLERHGDTLLDPKRPLLNGVLTALVGQLAATPDARFLSSDSLHRLADAALGVVAAHPGELPGLATKPWLHDFVAAAAKMARDVAAKKSFSPDDADALLRDALAILAKHPGLVVSGNDLPLTIASEVFAAVSKLSRFDGRTVGEAALRAALDAVASDPALATKQFGPVVSVVVTQVSGFVGQNKFTSDQAAGLAASVIAAVARNPRLFTVTQSGLAPAVVAAVEVAFSANSGWTARLLLETAQETLVAVARSGATALAQRTVAQFQQLLADVLTAGLATASDQLGQSTDLDGVPRILGGLVLQALQGQLTAFAPKSPQFIASFQSVAARIPPRQPPGPISPPPP